MNLMIPRSPVLAAAALVTAAILAAPAFGQGNPRITIESLAEGSDFESGTVAVRVDVANFDLKTYATAGPNEAGAGHVHYFVDGQLAKGAYPGNYATTESTFVEFGLAPGTHSIRAELVNHDHSSLRPPVTDEVTVTVSPGAPAIGFTAPQGLTPARDGKLTATVEVARFTLADVDLQSPVNEAGHGHIHWFLDGKTATSAREGQIYATRDTTFEFAGVGPGFHTLRAELVNNDHSPLDPPVYAELRVNAPTVAFDSPEDKTTTGADVPVRISVGGFDLAAVSSAPENAPGAGHVHFFVDGAPAQGAYATPNTEFVFTGLADGTRVLTAELVNHDHSSLDPPVVATRVVTVKAQPSTPVPGPRPTLAIAAPAAGEVGSDFAFRVDVTGFELVPVTASPSNAPGKGHVHYFIDGQPAPGDYATHLTTHEVKGLAAGRHVLKAELVNNDHRPLDPPVAVERAVTVTAAAGQKETPALGVALALAGVAVAFLVAPRRGR